MSSFILLLTPLQNKCFCSLNSHPVVYFIIQEMYGFPVSFSQHGKIQPNTSYGKDLESQYSYFSHSVCAFFPIHSHPMVGTTPVSNQFPVSQENAAKSIGLGEPRKLVPILSPNMGTFLPSDSHPMVYFTTWEMHSFPINFQ